MLQQPVHPLTKRAKSKLATCTRITGTARELFIAEGYEASTIRDIAQAASFSTGAFFASYKSKEEVLCVILKAEQLKVQVLLDEAKDIGESLAGRIASVLSAHHRFWQDKVGLLRAWQSQYWAGNKDLRAHTLSVQESIISVLHTLMAEARVSSPRLKAELLWHLHYGDLEYLATGPQMPSPDEHACRHLDVVLRP